MLSFCFPFDTHTFPRIVICFHLFTTVIITNLNSLSSRHQLTKFNSFLYCIKMNIAIETTYLIIFSSIQPLLVTDPIGKSDGYSNGKPEFIFVILLNYQEIALAYYDRSFQIQTCLESNPLCHQRTGHQFFPSYSSWKYQQVIDPDVLNSISNRLISATYELTHSYENYKRVRPTP